MRRIIERFCKYYQKYNPYTHSENAAVHIRTDGTFGDVDYTCESRSAWSLARHMHYVAALALLYDRTKDENYAKLSNLALAHWAAKDYRNTNWWHNDIGTPRLLMHSALFLGDALAPSNLDYVLSRLPDTVEEKWTGANKSWLAENVICKGLLLGNASMVREGSDIIKSTIFVSERGVEGIQKDYSFTQHGVQLYNHGYGLSFINNVMTWGYILRESDFAFSEQELDIMTNLCLKGTYRMFRKNTMDFHPRSREIVRGVIGEPGDMKMHIPGLELLLELNTDTDKKALLSQVYNHITTGARMPQLEGNNMYWCVDYMTHVKEKYYASVRWASENVLGGDIQGGVPVNSENLLAGFAAYGGTCYMVSGKEYENILPVWDWGMLPGTTTPHIEMPVEIGGFHESTFVGGVSDGVNGVIAADVHKTYNADEQANFGGKCASFLFDDVIVHLGNSLNTTSQHDFNTCFNQCLLNGEILVDGNTVKENAFTAECISSVYHDSIAYYNLDSAPLCMQAGAKSGDWYRVYAGENVPKEKVTKDVFLLYKPQDKQNGAYAYAVVPGIETETYKTFDVNKHIQVLANCDVQAVYDTEHQIFGAVFYVLGACICAGMEISVSAPCIALYDFKSKTVHITVPEPNTEVISVAIGLQRADITVPTDKQKATYKF